MWDKPGDKSGSDHYTPGEWGREADGLGVRGQGSAR